MKLEKDSIHSFIDRIVYEIGSKNGAVIPLLHAIQNEFNYLPESALQRVCEITDITPAVITGVSTFYSQFRHTPVGQHIIRVCTGTACHVKGSGLVVDAFRRELKIAGEGDTDPESLFTIQKIACLGCCTLAPVVQIDEVTFLRSGDAIMAVGTASYELQPKDGPLQEFSARWTDFRRVEDGQWVYVSDHAQMLAPSTPYVEGQAMGT